MKNLILILAGICLITTGCATSKIATDIGTGIGGAYQEAAAKGVVSAEKSIEAWPYISGLIKGLLSEDYRLTMAPMAQDIIKELDTLSEKGTLTDEEKGFVIGSFCRLEALAIIGGWDRYGVSITNAIRQII